MWKYSPMQIICPKLDVDDKTMLLKDSWTLNVSQNQLLFNTTSFCSTTCSSNSDPSQSNLVFCNLLFVNALNCIFLAVKSNWALNLQSYKSCHSKLYRTCFKKRLATGKKSCIGNSWQNNKIENTKFAAHIHTQIIILEVFVWVMYNGWSECTWHFHASC